MIVRSLLFILVVAFSFACNSKSQTSFQYNQRRSEITVATWNIGHFSSGKKDYSVIQSSDYEKKVNRYRSFVYDSIKADVLCINEYESEFCQDSILGCSLAEEVVFDGYRIQRVMKKNRYVCNAIFSNIDLKNVRKNEFAFAPALKKNIKNITWFYFVTTDIFIDGEPVKLVCTHLINRHENECQYQMLQLIEKFKHYDKVIICGDTNSWNWSKFKKAGYYLANDGTIITYPLKSYALDNIFAKGLKISDVRVVKTDLSDHYVLVCKISLK